MWHVTGDILENVLKNKFNMSKIDQKTLVPFVYIAIILIGIDMVITAAGLRLGLEEGNFITLRFMNMFGDFYGLVASIIGKNIIVIFPMIVYQYVQKELETAFLKNIYWTSYMGLIIVTIITTLITDINNIMAVINQLQYQDYIHSLGGMDGVGIEEGI